MFEKLKEIFEKIFGKEEKDVQVDEEETKPVEGTVIENEKDVKGDNTDEGVKVDGNSSNPFADDEE